MVWNALRPPAGAARLSASVLKGPPVAAGPLIDRLLLEDGTKLILEDDSTLSL